MSNSLRDQLLKSGLVNEQQAKHAETEKRRHKRQHHGKKRAPPPRETAQQVAANDAAKRERDRALNRQRENERRSKADEHAARELVVQHEIPHGEDGDIAFHFTQGAKVKHIYVNAEQHKKLVHGELAIARTRGRFRLIPQAIVERARAMAPFLIVYSGGGVGEDQDPAYAEHPVPDDIMW